MGAAGRWLIGVGLMVLLAGAALVVLSRSGFSAPTRFPGDLMLRGRNWVIFLPLGTSLALSLLLSLVLCLLSIVSRH